MSEDHPATNGGGVTAWVVVALILAAIVLLVLFARGPEDQERSVAPPVVAGASP